MVEAYRSSDVLGVNLACDQFLQKLDILNTTVGYAGSEEACSFELWLAQAMSWSTVKSDQRLFAFNAWNVLTRWGPEAQNNDYASRLYRGLIDIYYRRRWSIFCDQLKIATMTRMDAKAFSIKVDRMLDDFERQIVDVSIS
jgi:hypothetical protein